MKYQSSLKWYDRIEPNLQVKLLKEIALKDQSQTMLKEKFKKFNILYTTLDASLSKLRVKYNLIQVIKEVRITKGKRAQKLLGLTKKGIIKLVESHYQYNKKNNKKGISGNPYLNAEEFGRFLFNLFDKHSTYQNIKDNHKDWINPNLTKKDVIQSYKKANPNILIDQLKDKSKLKKIQDKIDLLESDLAQVLYESFVIAFKK